MTECLVAALWLCLLASESSAAPTAREASRPFTVVLESDDGLALHPFPKALLLSAGRRLVRWADDTIIDEPLLSRGLPKATSDVECGLGIGGRWPDAAWLALYRQESPTLAWSDLYQWTSQGWSRRQVAP